MRNRIAWMCGLAVVLTLGLTTPPVSAAPPAPARIELAKGESPFACTPSALLPAERKEHFDVEIPKLRALRQGVRELPDGYEFAFPSDPATYRLLSRWMYQERLCCPFFDLSLRIDREGGPLWLRFTGRKGVKDFITADFPEPWFRPGTVR